ncbi:hypothetical protein IAR55_001676 [Kwoniella newhampshirensis]|uniref:Flavoprotein domain-containing protein n=1 Tax=Kwoniella newhampshirensis TaxID=1651941 RepID=A0AAW0Z2S5_9TREE
MQSNYPYDAHAGPSCSRIKPRRPFVSAQHKPEDTSDGIFRVVLITSGSVASIKAPDIVGALVKSPYTDVQVVTTRASSAFYTQDAIDQSVRQALDGSQRVENGDSHAEEVGVRVWTDEDEWSDWKKVGDPILHIELRRWADLVVVAPCSADMLAKIAGGICDSLATSLLRALSPFTPVILCPAMNTHMYEHPFTARHLKVIQEELGYLVSGPQGAGKLACGDEGPGKMTDWREIVSLIEGYASVHKMQFPLGTRSSFGSTTASTNLQDSALTPRPPTPPTPGRAIALVLDGPSAQTISTPSTQKGDTALNMLGMQEVSRTGMWTGDSPAVQDWKSTTDAYGGNGTGWSRKWWMG